MQWTPLRACHALVEYEQHIRTSSLCKGAKSRASQQCRIGNNELVIRMITKGRSSNLSHISRTLRVDPDYCLKESIWTSRCPHSRTTGRYFDRDHSVEVFDATNCLTFIHHQKVDVDRSVSKPCCSAVSSLLSHATSKAYSSQHDFKS